MNNLIRVSVQHKIIGKPEKRDVIISDGTLRPKHFVNGCEVNLGYGWQNCNVDYAVWFERTTVKGKAVGPYLLPSKDGHRIGVNFKSNSLLLVDIDTGKTIDELKDDLVYRKYGGGFYTTSSHTEEHHKFRIVFRLEEDITDGQVMKDAYNAFIRYYGGDKSCHDPSRIFYGTVNAIESEITDRILPTKIWKLMVEKHKQVEEEERIEQMARRNVVDKDYPEPTDEDRARFIELASNTFLGNYIEWRNFGWAMKAGGYNLSDFIHVTTGMMNSKSAAAATKVWVDGSNHGYTINTAYYMLNDIHGVGCLKPPLKDVVGFDKYLDTRKLIKKIKG